MEISTPVRHADGSEISIKQLDISYGQWVHTGRNLNISQCDSEYAQRKINDPNVYPISKHIRGKVVLICNTGYQSLKLFKDLFIQMKYKVGVFVETSSEFMHKTIEEEARRPENKLVDSFVVVIYGIPDGFNLEKIVAALHTSNAPHLANKPKLVYLIGPSEVAKQVQDVSLKNTDPDLLIGATGFHGLMLVIYVFCKFVHELSARDIWRVILQYADYHRFLAATHCTLKKECYFFPGVSQSALPDELANLNPQDIAMYRRLVEQGSVRTYNIRLMFVGLFGAGKTTTARRMMGQSITGVTSTDGIDVYIGKCKVDLTTNKWETVEGSRCKPLTQLSHEFNNPKHSSETMDTMTEIYSRQSAHKRIKLESQRRQTSTESSELQEYVRLDSSVGSSFERVDSFDDVDMRTSTETEELNIEALTTAQRVLMEANRSGGGCGDIAVVSLWDFAGQFVYYATHQLFFSPRSIYLLVLNLAEDLEKTKDKWYMDFKGITSIETQGGVNFWLSSIYTYAKGKQRGVPPIILVGTHKDEIPGSDEEKKRKARKYFRDIREIFLESPIAENILKEDILLDNSIQDSNIDHLKNVIIEVSKGMSYWGEDHPAKWIELEQALDDRREDGTTFITIKELLNIDSKLASPLGNEDHLRLFLRVHHEMGTFIYFQDSPILRNTVILEPQWIINAFRHLIRAIDFDWKYGELQKKWHEFNETGKLDIQLAQDIWAQDNTNHFYENYDMLLEILEKLDIIVKARQLNADGITTTDIGYYYVPCLIKELPPGEIFDTRLVVENAVATPVLCYQFLLSFVPPAIYNRVISLCMGRWPVARRGKKLMLFCGWAVFEIKEERDEDRHRLHVFFKNSKIGLRLVRYSTKNKKNGVDPYLCDRVRRFVSDAVRKEFRRFDQFDECEPYRAQFQNMEIENVGVKERDVENLPFEYKIQCKSTNANCILEEGLHSVVDLKDELEGKETLESESTCTKEESGPHQYKPFELLQDWFPEKIPENLRKISQTKTSNEIWMENLTQDKKTQVIEEEHLPLICKAIGKHWKFLMLELGLSQIDIEKVEHDHVRDVNWQKVVLMNQWRSEMQNISRLEPSVSSLLNALTKRSDVNVDWDNMKTLIEKLKKT